MLMKNGIAVVMLVATILLLVGCKQGYSNSGTPADAAGATGTPAATTAGLTTVKATLADFSITLDPATVPPVGVHFMLKNSGKAPHALAIKGDGADMQSTTLASGESAILDVTGLKTGSYRIWCPIGNHVELGMETKLTVAAAKP
jgi:uncharacterized cupredoxin-like copper-binding protein